jgi:hypothetical protein
MLNGGGRNAHRGGGLANAAECLDDVQDASHTLVYDFRTFPSTGYATFGIENDTARWQGRIMWSSASILETLIERGVTQGQIADVLGIATSGGNRLFKPAAKTGKPRKLTYDEGVLLIERFGLEDGAIDTAEAISLPTARLAVQYVSQQLGVQLDPDDERVGNLAQDILALSEFVATSRSGEAEAGARGFLRGLQSRAPARP